MDNNGKLAAELLEKINAEVTEDNIAEVRMLISNIERRCWGFEVVDVSQDMTAFERVFSVNYYKVLNKLRWFFGQPVSLDFNKNVSFSELEASKIRIDTVNRNIIDAPRDGRMVKLFYENEPNGEVARWNGIGWVSDEGLICAKFTGWEAV